VTFFEITEEDKELVKQDCQSWRAVLTEQKYNHTVGAAVKR